MSTVGAIRENTRRNESIDRGTAAVTGSLVVTVAGTPGPIRQVTHAMACINAAATPGLTASLVTVGNFTNNTFTIYVWMPTAAGDGTLIASTAATNVEWIAWGNLSAGQGF